MKKKLIDFLVTMGLCIAWGVMVRIVSFIVGHTIIPFLGIASFICLIVAILKYYDIPFRID
jgi:hypothetical protein